MRRILCVHVQGLRVCMCVCACATRSVIVKPRMLWSGKQVCGAYYAPTCKACLRVCICAGATQSVNVKPRTLWSGKQVCGAYCAPTCKACVCVCVYVLVQLNLSLSSPARCGVASRYAPTCKACVFIVCACVVVYVWTCGLRTCNSRPHVQGRCVCVCVCVCVFGATVGVPFLLIEWLAGTCQFKWVVCVCVCVCLWLCVCPQGYRPLCM